MSNLVFLDQSFEKAFLKILIKQKIDLIVTSNFIRKRDRYTDIRDIIDYAPVRSHRIKQKLTLDSVDQVLSDISFKCVLIVGGGRLIDFFKLLCVRRNAKLFVILMNISNDGFISGCSALPRNERGGFVTVVSKKPEIVYVFSQLLKRMPEDFILSGLGEAMAKLQVVEELRFEYTRSWIKNTFHIPLKPLYKFLFKNKKFNTYKNKKFLYELTNSLYGVSSLMEHSSALCSRSEHEFEKVCVTHSVNLRHGILVLLGALVSMKVRERFAHYFDRDGTIFTYKILLHLIDKFKMTDYMLKSLQIVIFELSNEAFALGLKHLSYVRPQRIGLWNFVDSESIAWNKLFFEIYYDLNQMKARKIKKKRGFKYFMKKKNFTDKS